MSGASVAYLSSFERVIELAGISMLNKPSMSLIETNWEGLRNESVRVVDRHMFQPVSPLNVIWHMVLLLV